MYIDSGFGVAHFMGILLSLVFCMLGVVVLYFVIKSAVKNGINESRFFDSQREEDARKEAELIRLRLVEMKKNG